jgi:hypothetical protein
MKASLLFNQLNHETFKKDASLAIIPAKTVMGETGFSSDEEDAEE